MTGSIATKMTIKATALDTAVGTAVAIAVAVAELFMFHFLCLMPGVRLVRTERVPCNDSI